MLILTNYTPGFMGFRTLAKIRGDLTKYDFLKADFEERFSYPLEVFLGG